MREDDVMAPWAAKRDAVAGTPVPIGRAVAGLEVVKVWKLCLGCGRSWHGNAFSKDVKTGWCDDCIDKQEAALVAAKHPAQPTLEIRRPVKAFGYDD